MSKNDPIMQRMKENYEKRSRTYLTRRVPVIMRLDGKAFHTYTRGLDKPFDEGLIEDMQETAKFLCSEIQGAKCAYVQSDEISILITDFDKINTSAWFDYNVQKMTSVSAGDAAGKFNQLRFIRDIQDFRKLGSDLEITSRWVQGRTLANFDSRVFNIPKEEVPNYFYARQRDAVKNSVSMLAQSLYSHSELHGKNGSEMQEMCWQKGHNWNELHFSKKRGSWIIKNEYWDGELVLLNSFGLYHTGKLFQSEKNYGGDFTTNTGDLAHVDRKDVKIRSKWEVVETPMKLNDENLYKRWLR